VDSVFRESAAGQPTEESLAEMFRDPVSTTAAGS
jgi:hypothetical protein